MTLWGRVAKVPQKESSTLAISPRPVFTNLSPPRSPNVFLSRLLTVIYEIVAAAIEVPLVLQRIQQYGPEMILWQYAATIGLDQLPAFQNDVAS